jgi:hypothetical protein
LQPGPDHRGCPEGIVALVVFVPAAELDLGEVPLPDVS